MGRQNAAFSLFDQSSVKSASVKYFTASPFNLMDMGL
jgi:hypothetical protein